MLEGPCHTSILPLPRQSHRARWLLTEAGGMECDSLACASSNDISKHYTDLDIHKSTGWIKLISIHSNSKLWLSTDCIK
jgi:hypothetical protein